MITSAEVRQKLVTSLSLDLVGPDSQAEDHYQNEVLPQAPSKWYLTGFLVPYEASVQERSDDTADDGLELEAPDKRGTDDETTPETASARKAPFPSSIGLSFLVSDRTTSLKAEIYWGDYFLLKTAEPGTDTQPKEKAERWQRKQQIQRISIPLTTSNTPVTLDIPHSNGLKLAISNRPVQGTTRLPPGTKAVSVFLVNHRSPKPDAEKDSGSIFQAQLTIHNNDGFIPRPDLRNQSLELSVRSFETRKKN
jgi:hypothetical protein